MPRGPIPAQGMHNQVGCPHRCHSEGKSKATREAVVICGQQPDNQMPKPPTEPVSRCLSDCTTLSAPIVETIGACANDVDGLWTPIHESNQRTNYN